MVEVIICIAALGAPLESESCWLDAASVTAETYCETANAFALGRSRPVRVTYCRAAIEEDHPPEVLAKIERGRGYVAIVEE